MIAETRAIPDTSQRRAEEVRAGTERASIARHAPRTHSERIFTERKADTTFDKAVQCVTVQVIQRLCGRGHIIKLREGTTVSSVA